MTTIRDAIRTATQDKVVTKEEWDNLVKPLAQETPKQASADARQLVRLFANDGFDIDPTVRRELRNVLRERGYDAPTQLADGATTAESTKAIVSSNVSEKDWAFRLMQVRAGRGDETVNVGVMDTGLDTTHEALQNKLFVNEGEIAGDGIDNDNNGYVDDVHGYDFNNRQGVAGDGDDANDMVEGWHVDENGGPRLKDSHGHGTHVSGIITKGTDDVNVMGLAVLAGRFNGELAAEGFDYAAANGAKVINMSFKVTKPADVEAMLEGMKAHPEILFVASAGNDGKDINSYDAVAYLKKHNLDNFVVTGSGDQDGKKASYSNYGQPWATHAATGSDVLSTTPNAKFQSMSGTSMASPNLGAAAAKMLIMDSALTPTQLKGMLADTTTQDGRWENLVNSGGQIDERAAYALAGLTGLVRREGISPEEAASKLRLSSSEREQLLPLVAKYVDTAAQGQSVA